MRAGLAVGVVTGLASVALAQPVVWEQEDWQAGMHWTWMVRVPQTAPYEIHAYVLRLERLLHCEVGVLALVSEEAGWVQMGLATFLRRPRHWPLYWDLVPETGTLPPFFAFAAMLPALYPGQGFQVTRAEQHLWGEVMFEVNLVGSPKSVRLPGGLRVPVHVFEVQVFTDFEFGEGMIFQVGPPPELADRISVEEWREGLASVVELLERGTSQRWELAVGFEVGWPAELKVYLDTGEGEETMVWEAKLVGIEVLSPAEVRGRLEAAAERAVYPTDEEAVRAALAEILPAP